MIIMSNNEKFTVTTSENGRVHVKGSRDGYDQYGDGIQAVVGGQLKIYQDGKWVSVSHAYVRLVSAI